MKTRLIAGAFLTWGDQILLLHRNPERKIAPGMWSCIGGHLEPEELNDPVAACLREIGEEAGIAAHMVKDLTLRYITTRHNGEEISTCYYFMGRLEEQCPLPLCDEGTLHWVSLSEMAEKPMTLSVKEITNHWLAHREESSVMLCAVNRENTRVTWFQL